MQAVLRRRAPEHSGEALEVGPLTIDPSRHACQRATARRSRLGPAEFKLLNFLMAIPSACFAHAAARQVWGDHVFIEERTVDVHVLRLRKALAPVNAQHLIQTVRGLGYRLSMQPDL